MPWPPLDRQDHRESRALADLRLDLQLAEVAPNDLVANRQAESGPCANFLGREERIANLAEILFGNAAAGVGDANRDVLRVVELRLDGDLALPLDGLGGIRDDVQEHLVDLRRRAFDLGISP
jgi:hypothetical protein